MVVWLLPAAATRRILAGCGSASLHPATAWWALGLGLRLLLILARPAPIPTSTRWESTERVELSPSQWPLPCMIAWVVADWWGSPSL